MTKAGIDIILFTCVIVGLATGPQMAIKEVSAWRCQAIEKAMADYADYDDVVSCDHYEKKLEVITHDDYKEILLTTRNEDGETMKASFLLRPDFSYHLQKKSLFL